MAARIRAPELTGRGRWLNTGGQQLRLADLRGHIVLLDFWTFACVNCLHVLDELRPLEQKWADVLVTIGVHSPKFTHEADDDALAAAVERYDVRHPVLNDPEMATWNAYAVRAWPTLVVIDPEGYIVSTMSGEGHAHSLDRVIEELVEAHEARGTLRRGTGLFVPEAVSEGTLLFPGKVAWLADGKLLISDTGHHSLVVLHEDLTTIVHRVGDGQRGFVDGPASTARFSEPQGVLALPSNVAAQVSYDVVVADTVNHALRSWNSTTGEVGTLAGSGHPWRRGSGVTDLSSPWDLAWYEDRVWIAMAGIHQLWTFDPLTRGMAVAAGTANEGLVDGPLAEAWFAQTSGLSSAGETLWVADSETSSLRYMRNGIVTTAVGAGLFDFGHRDGDAAQALLQHPLGVCALPDGSVAVLDTYNDALRRYDPAGSVSTVATGLREPSGAVVDGDELIVVESAAHRLTRVPLSGRVDVPMTAQHTPRPPVDVAPGEVQLQVVFEPPPGQQLDERYGPATRLAVNATPPSLLRAGDGRDTALTRSLLLDPQVGDGVLHVAAMAASCDVVGTDADADTNAEADAVEFPACHVHQQDWGVPVRITADGADQLTLVLRGSP
ncbi:MAG TPA: NHL domain-containing thioredoxin family protein [Acidothermales bacterium]